MGEVRTVAKRIIHPGPESPFRVDRMDMEVELEGTVLRFYLTAWKDRKQVFAAVLPLSLTRLRNEETEEPPLRFPWEK